MEVPVLYDKEWHQWDEIEAWNPRIGMNLVGEAEKAGTTLFILSSTVFLQIKFLACPRDAAKTQNYPVLYHFIFQLFPGLAALCHACGLITGNEIWMAGKQIALFPCMLWIWYHKSYNLLYYW